MLAGSSLDCRAARCRVNDNDMRGHGCGSSGGFGILNVVRKKRDRSGEKDL